MKEGEKIQKTPLTQTKGEDRCMNTGYKFSPRLHINLFGHALGTEEIL